MGLIALKCPYCGADIQFEEDRESGFCSYCGSKIINDNVKTLKVDNTSQLKGSLKGALNSFLANDQKSAEALIEEAMKQDGNCSDALYLKSMIMLKNDLEAACSYHSLAKGSKTSMGIVTEERYDEMLHDFVLKLRNDSCLSINRTMSSYDCSDKNIDDCWIHTKNTVYSPINEKFPYLSSMIKEDSEKAFQEIEHTLDVPNEIAQGHWNALQRFDRECLVNATAVLFSNESLMNRYSELMDGYYDRLNNKWIPLLRKGSVDVNRTELSEMKSRAVTLISWKEQYCR